MLSELTNNFYLTAASGETQVDYSYEVPETQRRTFLHFHLCSFTITARVYHTNAKKQEQGVAGVSLAQCSHVNMNWFPSEVLSQDGHRNATKVLNSS